MALFLVGIWSCAAVANGAINASDYINAYNAHINNNSSKTLEVVFTVTAPEPMNKIGAKTIVLQERPTGSTSWNPVETYSYETTSGMLKNAARTHTYSVFYYDAVPNYSYRAKVYFYAEKGGYDTIEYITSSIKAE